ncbi:MAG: deoxyguanosinetriphosphate triphosphohydrolase-like protein [Candidatus Binatia bacterium]|nr:MAG: deoxyguanosinetriphosphate triphosphohydrolase-like protein [Candidatus Binatia bacterium]
MTRDELLQMENTFLAPYATRSSASRGRSHPEEEHTFRLPFQRDRDRIIHSTAFRRLEYKTQVFVNHEGDYYRTRLTHTMEAAQIARTVAQALRLNQDLAEAIALAHDLGHTPFGHAGERVLHRLMEPYGGFEHNAQSLRIVEVLEERYPQFKGLNLTWEVREGIVKHSPPYDKPLAQRFDPGMAPSLEAQIVDYADEIAYNTHDIDDGLKSGLLDPEQLEAVRLWRETYGAIRQQWPSAGFRIWRYQVQRSLINLFVMDLIEATRARIARERIDSLEAVQAFGRPLVGFSEELDEKRMELKEFLFANLYRHYRVTRMMAKAQRVMEDLFRAYLGEPRLLPPHILGRCERDGEALERVVCDYIAGMTDRFALEEHRKLFDPEERV